ncbi:flippase-like domain-containing protein [candidate division KSB1 bacterium]|nr:flippase-like domain-containing protein [candidate division KSB1 bacterium]
MGHLKKMFYFSYVLISLLVLIGIFLFTTRGETWTGIFKFDLVYLPPILLAVLLKWMFDGLSLKVLVDNASQVKIGILEATTMRLKSYFVYAVVPIVFSAAYFQIYLLAKEKMSPGYGAGITALRATLPICLFAIILPIALGLGYDPVGAGLFQRFLQLATFPVIAALFLLSIGLFFPQLVKGMFAVIISGLQKIRVLSRFLSLEPLQRVFKEISDELTHTLLLFFREKKIIIMASALFLLISLAFDLAIPILVLGGFGCHPPLGKSVLIQLYLKPILYFAPTPGASGISELGYAGFFGIFAPAYLVGLSVLLWRFASAFLGVITGGVLLLNSFK